MWKYWLLPGWDGHYWRCLFQTQREQPSFNQQLHRKPYNSQIVAFYVPLVVTSIISTFSYL